MRQFRYILFFLLMFLSLDSFCQNADQVEMADVLRRDGKIYTVVAGLVIILTAMIVLLVRVDRKIFKVEKELKKNNQNQL